MTSPLQVVESAAEFLSTAGYDVAPAEGVVPGLFDVRTPSGAVLSDLTIGQLLDLARQVVEDSA